MGKASSSKKVARAARAGGPIRPNQRRWAFPAGIAAIIVLGLALIVVARQGFSESQASAESPTPQDHWHAAYGVYVCDAFQPPFADLQDQTGIHTHDDGIIHIHPFSAAHAGKKATFGKWGQAIGVEFAGDSITLPDGNVLKDGYDCAGQPGNLTVYKWPADDPSAAPEIFDGNFGDIRLDLDRAAYTIAVVPEGVEVPKPESIPTLDQLTDVPGAAPATPPVGLTPTVPGGTPPIPGQTPAGDPAAPPVSDPAAAPPASEPAPSVEPPVSTP